MRITKPFLHGPEYDPVILREYVPGKEESDSLEFKRQIPKVSDLARDIAALANSLGGDLVVGIEEHNDRAVAWNYILPAGLAIALQQITQALGFLRPGDFISSVVFAPVELALGSYVIVISVPPSSALVSVQDGAKPGLYFPLRVGTHTKYLAHEDVMQRSMASPRTMYLRLLDLERQLDINRSVRICGRVGALSQEVFVPCPMDHRRHAVLTSLGTETLTLSMYGFPEGLERDLSFRIRASAGPIPGNATTTTFKVLPIPDGQLLQVPYDLLRAVWLEESANENCICIAFDGFWVLWDGEFWGLVPPAQR